MKRIQRRQREIVRKNNEEKWNRELEFWKKNYPLYFRNIRYDNDVIKLTYAEFKSLIKAGEELT